MHYLILLIKIYGLKLVQIQHNNTETKFIMFNVVFYLFLNKDVTYENTC